jgi:glycerate dehydrogenase
MKITILDGYTLNPGDLSWDGLKEFGQVEIFDRTAASEVAARSQGAKIVLTNKALMTRESLLALDDLQYIGVLATGYNIVDIEAAKERGVVVSNVPGYSTASVAQSTFALLLELTHHAGEHSRSVHDGQWSRCSDFSYQVHPLRELSGLTMGLVGFGDIAKQVAKIATAFGMRVLVTSRSQPAAEVLQQYQAQFVDLETLLRESDVVSLHCPLTPQTQNLINRERLALMKRDAFLLNTARGPLIEEAELAQALKNNVIAGAGLDVLSVEPPAANHPLTGAPNCIITPHNAWATRAARERLMAITIENIRAFLNGDPQNKVC